MSINSTNNKNLYVAGSFAVGAGLGAGSAYFTEPFLQDNAPTDEFSRKIYEKLEKLDENEWASFIDKDNDNVAPGSSLKETFTEIDNKANEQINKAKECKTLEDFKNFLVNSTDDPLAKSNKIGKNKKILKEFLDAIKLELVNLSNAGALTTEKLLEFIKLLDNYTPENIKNIQRFLIDHYYKNMSLEEALELFEKKINIEKDMYKNYSKKLITNIYFANCWDNVKNTFNDCGNEGLNKIFKKAARAIQGKFALIYGAIGSTIFGSWALFQTRKK